MSRQAQAGSETGRPQGRGTHAWQPQVYLGTGAGRPVGEEVPAVAGRPASQPRPGPQGGQLGGAGLTPVCFLSQLEQFNMIENAISSSSLYSPGSTLNYSQAAMMGLTGSHGSLPDTQQLSFPSHGSIPNIILTGERPGEMESLPCVVRRDGAEVSLPKEARTH